ncbi:MAG: VanZ family protein [Clostridia bacterium]|nr:VanZ family protein [Clostridia bacterium]
MKKKILRYVSLCLLLIWMSIIFFFSSQPAAASNNTSGGIVEKVAAAVYPSYDKLNDAQKASVISNMSGAVRKSAHFFEYAVLGALIYIFVSTFKGLSGTYHLIISLVSGLLYAISDEVHQLFVEGRSCGFTDVMIDFAGVLIAAVVCYLISLRRSKGE